MSEIKKMGGVGNFFTSQIQIQQETTIEKQKTDRRTYFKVYNDRMKEKRKLERLKKQKDQEKENSEKTAEYYRGEAIKVLMSFGEYTELNKEKKQLWLDFNWTLKDCREMINEGLGDIVMIMKLEQVASKLIRDYWETAKSEERSKSKSWNVLSEEEKDRLIKYWGRKKANVENGYKEENERLKTQGDSYLKEIERAKHHEERGKIKCLCGFCEQEAIIRGEVKTKIRKEQKQAEKELDDFWETDETEKGECYQCGKVKKLNEDRTCKKCSDYL